jgi:hypothetical protein
MTRQKDTPSTTTSHPINTWCHTWCHEVSMRVKRRRWVSLRATLRTR